MRLDDIPDVMGLDDLADILGLNVNALRRSVSNGTIPADKVGGKWFVFKEALFPEALKAKKLQYDLDYQIVTMQRCPVQTFYDGLSNEGKVKMDEYMKFLEFLEKELDDAV